MGVIRQAVRTRRQGRGYYAQLHWSRLAGAYLALASPIIAILALAGCHRVTRALLTAIDPARLLLAAGILPLATYFLLHALHGRVQPNWMAPLYPLLAICGALAVERSRRCRPSRPS
jgi:hypothetical protein